MEFKKFSAGNHSYGNSLANNRPAMRVHSEKGEEDISNVNFDDPKFYKHFGDRNSENYDYIEKIILNLALCHSIIIENKGGKVSYNASSPDELALVNAARFFGAKFTDRDEDNNMTIVFKGKK
jgi:phospholipid-transporting ATPase